MNASTVSAESASTPLVALRAGQILDAGAVHRVPLVRPSGARILWINGLVAMTDPAYQWRTGDAYGEYLLEQCAYLAALDASSAAAFAIADYYGGVGLGAAGGGFQSLIIGDYHLCGAGDGAPERRALAGEPRSGLLTLIEGVHEAVCSEIVGAEYPCGAVPVLALIEVTHESGTTSVLLVRRLFTRVAHLELGAGLLRAAANAQLVEEIRVANMWQALEEQCSDVPPAAHLRRLARRWAQQAAYGQVHRLAHMAPASTAVTLEGALSGFSSANCGFTESAYSRAATRVCLELEPGATGGALDCLEYHWRRFTDVEPAESYPLVEEFAAAREREIAVQVLRRFGLTRAQAHTLLSGPGGGPRLTQLLNLWLRERTWGSLFEAEEGATDAMIWEPRPPNHLVALSFRLKMALAPAERALAARRAPCTLTARPELSLSGVRSALAALPETAPVSVRDVSNLIRGLVARNRRDAYQEYPHSRWCGVACAQDFTLSLYQSLTDGLSFAFVEWALPGPLTELWPSRRVPGGSLEVHGLQDGLIRLGNERESQAFEVQLALR